MTINVSQTLTSIKNYLNDRSITTDQYLPISWNFLNDIKNVIEHLNDRCAEYAKDAFVKDNNDKQRKWVVYRVGGEAPTVCHDTIEAAETEARRLSEKHVNKEFFVAAVYSGFEAVQKIEMKYYKY